MTPDEIARLIDELERRFGPAGQAAFDMALRWKATDTFLTLAFGLVLIIGPLFTLWLIDRRVSPEDRGFVRGMGGLLTGVFVVLGVFIVASAVRDLANLEYATLRDLIGTDR